MKRTYNEEVVGPEDDAANMHDVGDAEVDVGQPVHDRRVLVQVVGRGLAENGRDSIDEPSKLVLSNIIELKNRSCEREIDRERQSGRSTHLPDVDDDPEVDHPERVGELGRVLEEGMVRRSMRYVGS